MGVAKGHARFTILGSGKGAKGINPASQMGYGFVIKTVPFIPFVSRFSKGRGMLFVAHHSPFNPAAFNVQQTADRQIMSALQNRSGVILPERGMAQADRL
ncbi:MAG: hypothetical protein ACRD19_12315 [Terriglobia bacterium]